MILLVLLLLMLLSPEAQGASGCNYPSSLDSYSNKTTGDYLTVADINSRSCAIEQLELRQSQVFNGISGGQTFTGGTGASQSLFLRSTANATKGTIQFGSNSTFNEVTNSFGVGTISPNRSIHVNTSGTNTMLLQTNGGTGGPSLELYHNAAVPDVGRIVFLTNDVTATVRQVGQIAVTYLDATASSQDSEMQFAVQNNSSGNANTIAKLSSLGVWTDASSAAIKDYEGDIPALDKLKELKTIGIYRAKGLPEEKIQKAERHYSPTAEDFHRVFGFGNDTTIAPKDAAWIAAKAVLELEARVQALEKVAP